MSTYSKLNKEINTIKIKLTKKAQKSGIYENFGQKEIFDLKDKYHYNDMRYGDKETRLSASLIDNFNEWAMTFSIRDLIKI